MKKTHSVRSSGETESALPRELELFEPAPDDIYSIETAALIADVPRRRIVGQATMNPVLEY